VDVVAAALLSAGGVDAGRGRGEGAAGMGVTTTATMKPRRRWVMKPQTLLMRDLQRLEGVHPDLRAVVEEAGRRYRLMVIEGVRTPARQKELLARGATKTLDSRHLTGHAVDLAPLLTDGRASWHWPHYHEMAPVVLAVAAEMGVPLVWGGHWPRFPDGPHFELDREAYPA
jgi:peptidoglycan L-alanyl-D-glutamate endopeptidase CwlK